jgi:hypothetical protein
MLAKKTSKNRITLPKAIVEQLPSVDYFEVSLEGGQVVLRPVLRTTPGARRKAIRSKLRALGLTKMTVEEAVRWARARKRK